MSPMQQSLDLFSNTETVPGIPVETHAEQAYLRYAMSVIRERALPAVTDGQKPSQRRILYAMHQLGLKSGVKPVKSARVVGEVIGKYHPHGDTAAYDTMVRMAQSFATRYPLVDGQGNFGSRDGASPAAQRYTESRLTPVADLLLGELVEGAAEFVENYDGTLTEPAALPARLPMLLLNGASGIAVGMATEIPSHQLNEVAQALLLLLSRPGATLPEILRVMPGPDFPDGGQIVSSPREILNVYQSGRGSLRVRARWTVEQLARKDWQIVVSELPPGVSAQTIMTELDAITNPRLKPNQKKLTARQADDRQGLLGLLDRVRDESGREHAVRLVIEPKQSRQSPDDLMAVLLARTSMEVSVPVNLVVLGLDGGPKQSNLLDMLRDFLTFRQDTVLRRTNHRLEQVGSRIEILRGRLICLLDLDAVLAVIREAQDPAAELKARFNLTDRQAQDILELRLRQLSRMEHIAVERELEGLLAEQASLNLLVADPAVLRKTIMAEIRDDAKRFGDSRRTLIEETGLVASAAVAQTAVGRPATEYLLRLSEKGWLQLSKTADAPAGFKAGDTLRRELTVRSDRAVHILSSTGRAYTLALQDLLDAGALKAAIPLASLRDLSGTPVDLVADDPSGFVLLAQSAGYGFICKASDLGTRQRAGKAFVSLAENSELLPAVLVEPDGFVATWTAKKCLIFPVADIKQLAGGGKGVQVMALGQAPKLVGTGFTADSMQLPPNAPAGWAATKSMVGRRANAGASPKRSTP